MERIPAQLLYDWLDQLSCPVMTFSELQKVLPPSAMCGVTGKKDEESTVQARAQDVEEGRWGASTG